MLFTNCIAGWVFLSFSERALKMKEVPKEVFSYLMYHPNFNNLNSSIICDLPNKNIHHFNGRLQMKLMQEVSLGLRQFLWRGSTLSTTKWAIGVVVYAGMDTKIMLNQGFYKKETNF